MPSTSQPVSAARLTTALMQGLRPGTSPPPVRMPMRTGERYRWRRAARSGRTVGRLDALLVVGEDVGHLAQGHPPLLLGPLVLHVDEAREVLEPGEGHMALAD